MSRETQQPQPESQEEKYREEANVNGIDIMASYDDGFGDYVLYFPQISVAKKTKKNKDVMDQLFRIDKNPENAKKVFAYTLEEAKNESDVYELYRKAEAFAKSIRE